MGMMGDSGMAAGAVGAPGGATGDTANGVQSKVRLSALWEGHSVFDAWLVAAASQIGFVLVTMPYTMSQMGVGWGVSACCLYGILGAWTVYLLVWLYLEFKSRLDLQDKVRPENYILQYHEVIGGLTGKWGRNITFFFIMLSLFMVSVIHLIASASNLYYANSSLDKRQWQYIVGGVAFLAVLVPDFGHFRVGALIGVATTTLTSVYMLVTALSYGQRAGVKHTGANDKVEFFTGVANIISTFAGHGITIEILESMRRPSAYKYICITVLVYALSVTLPSAVAVHWSAGDILLTHSNAFSVLPRSGWQTLAIASLVLHQAIGFVIFTHPIFLVCEKLVGVHTKRFFWRVLPRILVVAIMWFTALAVPFFGPINSLLGSLGLAIGMYAIPATTFLITYRTKSARENLLVQLAMVPTHMVAYVCGQCYCYPLDSCHWNGLWDVGQ